MSDGKLLDLTRQNMKILQQSQNDQFIQGGAKKRKGSPKNSSKPKKSKSKPKKTKQSKHKVQLLFGGNEKEFQDENVEQVSATKPPKEVQSDKKAQNTTQSQKVKSARKTNSTLQSNNLQSLSNNALLTEVSENTSQDDLSIVGGVKKRKAASRKKSKSKSRSGSKKKKSVKPLKLDNSEKPLKLDNSEKMNQQQLKLFNDFQKLVQQSKLK